LITAAQFMVTRRLNNLAEFNLLVFKLICVECVVDSLQDIVFMLALAGLLVHSLFVFSSHILVFKRC
jgi:hypothetical protein